MLGQGGRVARRQQRPLVPPSLRVYPPGPGCAPALAAGAVKQPRGRQPRSVRRAARFRPRAACPASLPATERAIVSLKVRARNAVKE